MKWDIDKALTVLAAPGVLLEKSITMVLLTRDVWGRYGIKPNVDPTRNEVMAWCLSIGRYGELKLNTYALTIREAHLKMLRVIKKLTQEGAHFYGVRGKPKPKRLDRSKAKKPVERKKARA